MACPWQRPPCQSHGLPPAKRAELAGTHAAAGHLHRYDRHTGLARRTSGTFGNGRSRLLPMPSVQADLVCFAGGAKGDEMKQPVNLRARAVAATRMRNRIGPTG